jgi:hypothetical protein
MLPSVEEQISRLKARHPEAEVIERSDGSIFIKIPNLPLPPGWDKNEVTIYLNLPTGYPTAKPNGFETDLDLTMADGRRPTSGCGEHAIDGHQYLHFCWQPGSAWEAGPDELWKRVRFALMRFTDAPL